MFSVFLRLAARNILLHRRKSLLAILAVAACCFSLNIFQGYIRGTESIFDDSYTQRTMYGDFLVRRAGVRHYLSNDEEDLLSSPEQKFLEDFFAHSPEVQTTMRTLRVNGTISNGDSQSVFTGNGYDIERGTAMRSPTWIWNTLAGRPLQKDGEENVVLGKGLAFLLGCEPSSQERFITGTGGYRPENRPFQCRNGRLQLSGATVAGQANAVEVQVVGILDAMFRELDLRYVNMPLKVAQRLMDTDRISLYTARLKDGADLPAVLTRLRTAASGAGFHLEAHSWKEDEVGDFYRRTMDFLHLFRNFMILVILSVALLSVFNTFFRNVQERIREIGVLRTLGFRVNQVRFLFLLETFFLALIGIAVGGGAAILVSLVVNRLAFLYKIGLLTQPVPFLVEQTRYTLAWTLAVALGVALVAAAIPLWTAGRKKITESLTHT